LTKLQEYQKSLTAAFFFSPQIEELQSKLDYTGRLLHGFRINNLLAIKQCHHLPYVHSLTQPPQQNIISKQSALEHFTKLLRLFQCFIVFIAIFNQSSDKRLTDVK